MSIDSAIAGRSGLGRFADQPEWRPGDLGGLPSLDNDEAEPLAALVLGIDRLRDVVDALGPAAGDEVLARMAARLEAHRTGRMMLAPLFGDAFALLVPGLVDAGELQLLAEQLHAATSAPIAVADTELCVSISVGVALGGANAGSPQGALRDAAAAQHRAQQLGGGRVEVFTPEADAGALEALQLEGELRTAVGGVGLSLFFQPIVSLESGAIDAVEALVRWDHPTLGLLLPGRFLPLAERTGILPRIERWVLREACRKIAGWDQPRRVSINVSAGALGDGAFVARVAEELRRNELSGEQLIIELSEGVALPAHSATRVEELRALGVKVYLDDVGSGYAWLTRRQRLPVDGLKLSRWLVQDLESPAIAGLAGLIVGAARTLGLPVIAEGVETHQQLERVRALGANAAQGLHFLGPVPANTLREVLELSRPGGGAARAVAHAIGETARSDERAVTLGQAAKLLGISASTLRRWTEDGRVSAVRTSGGHRRFYLSELTRLSASPAAELRVPELPGSPLPRLAEVLHSDGLELASAAARSLYNGYPGWFGNADAQEALRIWTLDLSSAFARGDYDQLTDSLRRLMLSATVGSASLVERHLFLERFALALDTRVARRELPQADQTAARRTLSALALAHLADQQATAPPPPARRRRATRQRHDGRKH